MYTQSNWNCLWYKRIVKPSANVILKCLNQVRIINSIVIISPNCHNHNPVLFFPNVTFRIRIITGIVPTRLIQQVSQGMQDRLTLLENLRITPDFGWVSVAQSLVFYLAFCLLLFVLLTFFLFCLCVFYLFSTQ